MIGDRWPAYLWGAILAALIAWLIVALWPSH